MLFEEKLLFPEPNVDCIYNTFKQCCFRHWWLLETLLPVHLGFILSCIIAMKLAPFAQLCLMSFDFPVCVINSCSSTDGTPLLQTSSEVQASYLASLNLQQRRCPLPSISSSYSAFRSNVGVWSFVLFFLSIFL